MGNRGRFGKYGEIKRTDRLKRSKISPHFLHGSCGSPLGHTLLMRKSVHEKAYAKIRPAKPSDISFIAWLSSRVFSVYGPYEDTISDWFESGRTVTLVAEMNKVPVGFAMISHSSHKRNLESASELLAIAVEPKKQRMGIGKMLIKEIERKAEDLNIRRLFLHTGKGNFSARRLFTKNGYYLLRIKKHFYPKGQDAMVMVKEIGLKTQENDNRHRNREG